MFLLRWSICPSPLAIIKLCCFLIVEFWEFFTYSGCKSCIRYVTCKYFLPVCALFFFFLIFFDIYLLLRDRAWAWEGQREGETQNLKQVAGSEMSAQSSNQHSDPWTMRSWHEPKLDAYRLSHLSNPDKCFFKHIKTEIIFQCRLTLQTTFVKFL